MEIDRETGNIFFDRTENECGGLPLSLPIGQAAVAIGMLEPRIAYQNEQYLLSAQNPNHAYRSQAHRLGKQAAHLQTTREQLQSVVNESKRLSIEDEFDAIVAKLQWS